MAKKITNAPVKHMVLDVLKPHRPNIIEFGKAISHERVESVEIDVYAVDEKTESVKVDMYGRNLSFEKIAKLVEDFGGVVHSVDKVVIGKEKKRE